MADPVIYEIPLSPTPQTFGMALAGVSYVLTVYWAAAPGGGWILNIADASGAAIVNGIAMVTGVNLLEGLEYLGFSGGLFVQTDHDSDALPTFENLGITSHLFFVPPL